MKVVFEICTQHDTSENHATIMHMLADSIMLRYRNVLVSAIHCNEMLFAKKYTTHMQHATATCDMARSMRYMWHAMRRLRPRRNDRSIWLCRNDRRWRDAAKEEGRM